MKDKKYGIFSSIFLVILGYFLSASLSSILMMIPMFSIIGSVGEVGIILYYIVFICMLVSMYYLRLRKCKKFSDIIIYVNVAYILIVFSIFTVIFVITKASLLNPLMNVGLVLAFPFLPIYIMMSLFSGSYATMLVVGIVLLYSLIYLMLITKKFKLLSTAAICFICAGCCLFAYFDSPNYKYKNQNHDFGYMNGFSSIDLSDYTPYSDSGKLIELDHEPEFMIENKADMPVLDGAEACYPVYSAVAKALYKDIDVIEKEYLDAYQDENGTIVTFYNTAVGFERLLSGDVDMFFGAKPSQSQLALAESEGVELEYTAIGKEAFVFFVNKDNKVDGLTSEEIRKIYHGDITNWKNIGGMNEEIIAFQRPECSGSQSMMVHFMGDVALKEPLTYEMESAMMGIIEEVAEYHNEAGAIGYSFRYFLEGLNQVEGVKMLSIDGVYPSIESIKNEEYPVITSLYCITVKGNENENVQKVLDFLLSEDGQYIIEKTGYSTVSK